MTTPLLEIDDLHTYFYTDNGVARAVDGVSFSVGVGETVGVVGESGCGKSVTALSILRLIRPPGRIEPGSAIRFEGRDLVTLDEREMQHVRGNRIAMVFQEPMTALNPVFTIGDQIGEVGRIHAGMNKRDAWAKAIEMLELVGIPAPAQRAGEYPHQLSGGMRQRVVIAMALVMNPALIIADEPTTALDVTIQAQILALMRRLQAETGMGILFITHNLGVVAHHADDVAVMYAGRVVEAAPVADLFARPQHPYTQGLLACLPGHQRAGAASARGKRRLYAIRGQISSPLAPPPGCAFEPRCDRAIGACKDAMPPLELDAGGRGMRCIVPAQPKAKEAA
jgi:peptide/nickel transport system ATP-binding protein